MEEVSKVGIFYKVQPEDREDKEGVWVAKDDIWESDSQNHNFDNSDLKDGITFKTDYRVIFLFHIGFFTTAT